MSYTTNQLYELNRNIPPDNFHVKNISFYNAENNQLIQDAISIDKFGKVTIKDSVTEAKLEEILALKKNIIDEKQVTDQLYTLYFTDKENTRVSMGEIYTKIFLNKTVNSSLVYQNRVVDNLNFSFDNWEIQTHAQ